jgi:hypothetical protein
MSNMLADGSPEWSDLGVSRLVDQSDADATISAA